MGLNKPQPNSTKHNKCIKVIKVSGMSTKEKRKNRDFRIQQRLGNENRETVPTVSHCYISSDAPHEKLAASSRRLKQLESRTERFLIVKPHVQHKLCSLILTAQNRSKAFLLLALLSSFSTLFSAIFVAIIYFDLTKTHMFGQNKLATVHQKIRRTFFWQRLDVDTIQIPPNLQTCKS